MTILAVNKFYWLKGGSERYFFELAGVLEARGHRVVPFAMQHPWNVPSAWSEHFVSQVEFREAMTAGARARAALRVVHSGEAAARVARLADEVRPEVAHLHNFAHQISPSILAPLKRRGVAIVHTLHDYKLVCPTYRLFRDGRPCELCIEGRYVHAVRHRCNEGSLAASVANAVEMYAHRLSRVYERHVDLWIAPSAFMRGRMIAGGLPGDRVEVLPYCLDLAHYPARPEPGEYLLFAGRLSAEKGVDVLIDAMRGIPGIELRIAGDGPLRAEMERRAASLPGGRIRFLGHLAGETLQQVIAESRLVIVPSVWYENSPLSIYEAFALGKPVVGARIGGIPELVEPGVTGELAVPGDAESLAGAIRATLARADLEAMGRRARERAEAWFDPEAHYRRLMSLYRKAGACVSR